MDELAPVVVRGTVPEEASPVLKMTEDVKLSGLEVVGILLVLLIPPLVEKEEDANVVVG